MLASPLAMKDLVRLIQAMRLRGDERVYFRRITEREQDQKVLAFLKRLESRGQKMLAKEIESSYERKEQVYLNIEEIRAVREALALSQDDIRALKANEPFQSSLAEMLFFVLPMPQLPSFEGTEISQVVKMRNETLERGRKPTKRQLKAWQLAIEERPLKNIVRWQGQLVATARKRLQITQEELAQRAGLLQEDISKIERGQYSISKAAWGRKFDAKIKRTLEALLRCANEKGIELADVQESYRVNFERER